MNLIRHYSGFDSMDLITWEHPDREAYFSQDSNITSTVGLSEHDRSTSCRIITCKVDHKRLVHAKLSTLKSLRSGIAPYCQ